MLGGTGDYLTYPTERSGSEQSFRMYDSAVPEDGPMEEIDLNFWTKDVKEGVPSTIKWLKSIEYFKCKEPKEFLSISKQSMLFYLQIEDYKNA